MQNKLAIYLRPLIQKNKTNAIDIQKTNGQKDQPLLEEARTNQVLTNDEYMAQADCTFIIFLNCIKIQSFPQEDLLFLGCIVWPLTCPNIWIYISKSMYTIYPAFYKTQMTW